MRWAEGRHEATENMEALTETGLDLVGPLSLKLTFHFSQVPVSYEVQLTAAKPWRS